MFFLEWTGHEQTEGRGSFRVKPGRQRQAGNMPAISATAVTEGEKSG
jgi:hypothetical protein